MCEIIPITWYFDEPIDFEFKQYTLLSYLQIVDRSFMDKCLSPHLLHMEHMLEDMNLFNSMFENIKKDFDKQRYIFFKENSKLNGENDYNINEIREIIEFSIPQVTARINFGNSILVKTKQILY